MRPVKSEIARVAESAEVRMNEAYWAVLPRALAEKRKMALFRVGGAAVNITPNSTSLRRNRVLGLGLEEPARKEMLDEIVDLFRAFRVKRFSFHLSPGPQSKSIARWLAERGFKLHHHYSKLFRPAGTPQAAETELDVRRIGQREAGTFARVFSEVFAEPSDRLSWIAAAVGAPGFSHYLAYDGDRAVATGLLFVDGDCGLMGWAGTLTPYRCRGAHTALIAARLKRAAALGAKSVVSATLDPQPGRPSGSYRDLLRQGFVPAYRRPIWVWESRGSARAS